MPESATLIVRSYCHVWDTKGQHAFFRTFLVVFNDMSNLGIECSKSTMRRIYNNEKESYLLKKPFSYTIRPDLTHEIFELDQEKMSRSKPPAHELEEPVIQAAKPGAAQQTTTTLPRKYFEEMKLSLLALKGTPGFGIRTVRVAAMRIWKKNFASILPGCLTPFNWAPSDTWCYHFLHLEMKYAWRRVTGKQVILLRVCVFVIYWGFFFCGY